MQETRVTLVERLRDAGDRRAWDDFAALYGPLVDELAKKRGLDREARAELFSEVFLRMVRGMQGFDYRPERGKFRGYVLCVALNVLRERGRKQQRVPAETGDELDELAELEAERPQWELHERQRILQLGLERLKERSSPLHFAVFELLQLREHDPGEVARFFGISKHAAATIKKRMKQRLHELLEEFRGDLE